MKGIILLFVLIDIVCSAIIYSRCYNSNNKNKKNDQETCLYTTFKEWHEIEVCFKPKSSFNRLKIQGFPNTNLLSSDCHTTTEKNIIQKNIRKLKDYVIFGTEILIPYEWNHLRISYKLVPSDDSTKVRIIISLMLNSEETKLNFPVHLNDYSDQSDDDSLLSFRSTILLIFDGGWTGSRTFKSKITSKSNRNGVDGLKDSRLLRTPKPGYSSNCEGLKIRNLSNVSDESVSKPPKNTGLLAGCTSAAVVGLILLLSILIYKQVRKSPPEEQSKLESISNQIVKDTNVDDKQEDDCYDNELSYQPDDDTTSVLKASLEADDRSDITARKLGEKNQLPVTVESKGDIVNAMSSNSDYEYVLNDSDMLSRQK